MIGAGWVRACVEASGQKLEMRVSFLHDSLGELTAAALHLTTGKSLYEKILFVDEPGECQLELRREGEQLRGTLTQFEEWQSMFGFFFKRPIPDQIIEFEVPTKKFAMEVLNVLYKLHQEHGVRGYREKWGEHGFPLTKYKALEAAIKQLP